MPDRKTSSSETIRFRVTPDQKRRLVNRARAAGLTLSRLIRQVLGLEQLTAGESQRKKREDTERIP